MKKLLDFEIKTVRLEYRAKQLEPMGWFEVRLAIVTFFIKNFIHVLFTHGAIVTSMKVEIIAYDKSKNT